MGLFVDTVSEQDVDENELYDKNNGKGDVKMLESNTDRSYFMIGAVMLAGIIIAAAVWIFDDQIFGDKGMLTQTFNDLQEQARGAVGNISDATNPNQTIMGLGARVKMMLDTMPLF